ncbi:MAG: (2Fe-2S) ferredoxin domain-containing protein [Clostridia bacterium]|nr:(2Fe-2S) ferredoxin domain-containing protein [Clostridia bacterium]
MKSLADLEAIRQKTINKVNLRNENEGDTRIVVGMATCGIAAGARPVMQAFVEEIQKRNLNGVYVSQTGCVGLCKFEPIVEVYLPGKEKVTYINMTAEKAAKVVNEHIVNGNVISEYTIGNLE